MNSPGFKRNDVFYSSLGNSAGDNGLGYGVHVGGNATNFSEGKHLPTENPSNLAITGQGFFIVRIKSGELLYTRAGDFSFNNDGVLIDRRSGGEVQGYDAHGNLVTIHEKGPKTSASKASSELFLSGKFIKLKRDDVDWNNDPTPDKSHYKNISFELKNVYDSNGKEHTIKLEFRSVSPINSKQPDNGETWELIGATYADGSSIDFHPRQQLVFTNNYGPQLDYSSIQLNLNNNQPLFLRFGSYVSGSDQSVILAESQGNPLGTEIRVNQNDGYGLGKQISFSFDEHGQISYNYDNGQSIAGIHVGLARFDDLNHSLVATQDTLFRAKDDNDPHIGRANKDGFGSIKPKYVESSNVDSTAEFANIVILQRMFQACSQIMDIDKQLLEGLESK